MGHPVILMDIDIDVKTITTLYSVVREQSPGAAGARIVILSKHVNMITC